MARRQQPIPLEGASHDTFTETAADTAVVAEHDQSYEATRGADVARQIVAESRAEQQPPPDVTDVGATDWHPIHHLISAEGTGILPSDPTRIAASLINTGAVPVYLRKGPGGTVGSAVVPVGGAVTMTHKGPVFALTGPGAAAGELRGFAEYA